jgi:hypothetical protein
MPRGRADLRDHGVAYGCSRQRRAGDALLGRVAAERNGADVFTDECLPFGALAEADLQPTKGPRLDTVAGEHSLRSQHWGAFLLSLKSLLETGKGRPAPNDIKLDSWE